MRFKDLLTDIPEEMKSAGVESPDEMQFEQDFADMAFTFLQDRAGRLLDYVLGFEIVERSEDGSRAVGIFGLNISDEYHYIPVFFLNGQIKGVDSIFSRKENRFKPLISSIIDKLLNAQDIELGSMESDTRRLNEELERPDFGIFRDPAASKRASDTAEKVAKDTRSAWTEMREELRKSAEEDELFRGDLARAISAMTPDALPPEKTASDSVLLDWMSKKGGAESVNVLMKKLAESDGKFANAALSLYPDVESLFVDEFKMPPPEKKAALRRVTTVSEDMDEPLKVDIVEYGEALKDERPDDEKSDLYDIDYPSEFSNPDGSGVYEVLTASGLKRTMEVYTQVFGTDEAMVRDPETGRMYNESESSIFVQGSGAGEVEGLSDGIDLNDMKTGGKYILVDGKGGASAPFRVGSFVRNPDERTVVMIESRYLFPDSDEMQDKFQLADHEGDLSNAFGYTIVPSNWKALSCREEYDEVPVDSEEDEEDEEAAREDRRNRPGTLDDLNFEMAKEGMHSLVVERNHGGDEYFLGLDDMTEGPYGYKTAQMRLAGVYGVDASEARDMLLKSASRGKARAMLKTAQQVSMPAIPEQSFGMDSYTGLPVAPFMSEEVPGETVGGVERQDATEYGFNMKSGPEAAGAGMDEAMQLAMEAAQSGQKSVFDHAAIGGLSKLYNVSDVVDSYIPEFYKALDRLGRILFLFYWKNKEFAARYGDEDLSSMEDLLRGVYRSFGDLVTDLESTSPDAEETADAAVMD